MNCLSFPLRNRELLTEGLFTFTKYILIIKLYFWQIDLEVFLTFQFVTRRRLPYWCTCPRYFLSSFRKHAVTTSPCINITVCNFQSMKSPVELNSLFLKFFCYYHLVWLDATLDALKVKPLCQILLFLRNNSLVV